MISTQRRLFSWIPALTGMGLIFWASSLPGSEMNLPIFPMSDKVLHFIAYSGLGWLISFRMVLRGASAARQAQAIPLALGPLSSWKDRLGQLMGMIYGASDEFHQSFVVLRDSSIFDWGADALGILAGSWLCRKMFRKRVGLT